MLMFLPRHSSPTTTVLADGYTDDALGSKYDNYRASRPYSRESLLSGTSLGSKVRLSQFSLLSRPDAPLEEEEGGCGDEENFNDTAEHYTIKEQKKFLQEHVRKMFSVGSIDQDEHQKVESIDLGPPKSFLGKCKYYYDKYNLHRIAACFWLILYAFLGAWLFYVLEHDYEKEVKGDVFVEYEKNLYKVRLPECLDWDYWGALFYVGTLFTTIGYGNIAPRTATGRALSVIYAIIGIPLVLAILSKCGRWLTTTLSGYWQQYRRHIKLKAKKTTNRLRGRKISHLESLEAGKLPLETGDADSQESRTIPIWLALLICVLYVCGCSSIFLIWETRWTFFTSLYFFCISLLTIGLGDIVPDHPHMFIIMFVLVILGLSIVSMLISVIQIKMEEWFYDLIKKIQQEYEHALESGEDVDRDHFLQNALDKAKWLKLAPPAILNEQLVEKKVEQIQRLIKESKDVQTDLSVAVVGTQFENYAQSMACDAMSNHVQPQHRETQYSTQLNELSRVKEERVPEQKFVNMHVASRSDYRDSISDATSLPLDSIASIESDKEEMKKEKSKKSRDCQNCLTKATADGGAQTDLAQFQIDEIAMRLASLQTQRVRPPIVERSMATSAFLDSPLVSQSEEILLQNGLSHADINVICEAMSTSFHKSQSDTVECGVGNEIGLISLQDRSQNTSLASKLQFSAATSTETLPPEINPKNKRSMNTSPMFMNSTKECSTSPVISINIVDDETQTSIREKFDVPTETVNLIGLTNQSTTTSPVPKKRMESKETEMSISGKVMVDRITSPVVQPKRDHNTSPHLTKESDAGSAEYDDRSMQTSIAEWFGKLFQKNDQSQQTSISDDIGSEGSKKSKKNKKKKRDDDSQTSLGSDDMVSSPSTSEEPPVRKSFVIPPVMSSSVTMSTQYSPPPGYSSRLSEPATHRARSSSTSGMGTSIFEEESRQEVIVQTDDSYLKIARRLDEYRHNKTQFLPVCAAAPLSSKEVEPFKEDRPSERSRYYFGLRKQSFGRASRKKSKYDMSHQEAQTGQSMDAEMLQEALSTEKSRSISPDRPSGSRKLTRNPSLPVGISRGKVLNYVTQHEKGIPNPATNRQSPVKIIRQYSMDQ